MNNYGECSCLDGFSGVSCESDMRYGSRDGSSGYYGAGNLGPSSGYKPPASTGYSPTPGTGYPPTSGTGYPPTSGTGYPPTSGTGYYPPATGFDYYSPYTNYPGTMPGGDYGYHYYTGQCSLLCQDGCTGPEASDCMSCVKNAHRNPYGVCACNKNYYGDTCEFFYIGKVFDKS
jgi:hypothetical protein